MVAARSLSPGALVVLTEHDANWIDQVGHVRLVSPPSLFVFATISAKAHPTRRAFRWSDSSFSIAEHLLCARPAKILLPEVAAKTGWSTPQASNVLAAFDRQGWTIKRGPRRGGGVWRELENPGSLLDAWTEHLAQSKPRRLLGHRLMRNPLRALRTDLSPKLDETGRWAVTGLAGLALAAPYLSTVPALQVYLEAEPFERAAERFFQACGIRKVDEGGNIEIRQMSAKMPLAAEPEEGVPVVNLPRLYADLVAMGGRAKDGADHLREVRLGY